MTKTKVIKTFFLTTLITLGFVAHADFTASDWKQLRAITPPPNLVVGAYIQVPIDRETNQASRSALADLRVISGSGTEVPYQLVVESEATRSAYVESALRDLSSAAGETMFILDLGTNRSVHDHLVINTGSKNFKRPVHVYAADENLNHGDAKWRLLSAGNYIYNFYDQAIGFNAGRGDVFYPENTSRYLRVVIGRGEGGEVSVGSVRVLRTLSKAAKLNQAEETAVVLENTKEQTTEIVVDLGAEGVPTRSATLSTTDTRNFNRRVVVHSSDDSKSWSTLGQGYVFQLDTPLFKGSNFSVPYTETTKRYVRVVIFNQDDQPIPWNKAVTLVGVARSVIFQSSVGQTYDLYVGNEKAVAPRYDMARFFEYIETSALPTATMGPIVPNSAYAAPKPKELPYTERNSVVLNVTLVILVGMITFLLISYLKKLKLTKPTE